VWGLGFSGGGTDWLICCNPDCFLRTAGSVSLPEGCHVGAQGIILNYRWMLYSYGISLPYSEHVDIFPVRLCLHSHWVFSVYLILAIYLHSRLYHCGRNKTQELDPSSLV
jgi:hypothetical protein